MPVELGNRLLGLLQDEVCKRRIELNPDSVDEALRGHLSDIQESVHNLPAWIKLAAGIRGQVNELLLQAESRGHFSGDRQVQLEALPIFTVVIRNIEAVLCAGKQQTGRFRIGPDYAGKVGV